MNLSAKGNEHVSIGFNSRREQRLIGREIFRSYLPGPAERCKAAVKALWRGKSEHFSEISVPFSELPIARDSADQHGNELMTKLVSGTTSVVPELKTMSLAVSKMNAFIMQRTPVAPEIIT